MEDEFAGHTPGPWFLKRTGRGGLEISTSAEIGRGATIYELSGHYGLPPGTAMQDAELMAQASSLLAAVRRQAAEIARLREACRQALPEVVAFGRNSAALELLRAALAAPDGKTPPPPAAP